MMYSILLVELVVKGQSIVKMTASEFLACNLALKPDQPCYAVQIGIMDDEILPCVMANKFRVN